MTDRAGAMVLAPQAVAGLEEVVPQAPVPKRSPVEWGSILVTYLERSGVARSCDVASSYVFAWMTLMMVETVGSSISVWTSS